MTVIVGLFLGPQSSRAEPPELREYLYSTAGTYGWKPTKGTVSYDFFRDGRLAVQGDDGEATMWEGTWKLKGDQLTLDIPALKERRTVTVSAKGGDLFLNELRYTRYKP